jgi:ABC-type transporter MlaC component
MFAATYAEQFDGYSGQQLQATGERTYGPDVLVQTKIVKSNGRSALIRSYRPGASPATENG